MFRRNQIAKAKRLLVKGKVDKAVRILEKERAWDTLVGVYRSRGDLRSAVNAAERGGLATEAATLYERMGDYSSAANWWQRAGRPDREAAANLKAGDIETAATLFEQAGMPHEAAEAYLAVERYSDAGRLYETSGEHAAAIDALRRGGQHAKAAELLGQAGQYDDAARECELGGQMQRAAELFLKGGNHRDSARCYADLGRHADAGHALEAGGFPLDAADEYALDEATLAQAAETYEHALRPRVVWQKSLDQPLLSMAVSDYGKYIVLGTDKRGVWLLDDSGTVLWRFRPVWGGQPLSVFVSRDGDVVAGCDDRRVYAVDKEQTLLWSAELSAEPVHIARDTGGEHVFCCLSNNTATMLGRDGAVLWQNPIGSVVCACGMNQSGDKVVLGTVDGRFLMLDEHGEEIGHWRAPHWVDSLALNADGSRCALGLGMSSVGLLDTEKMELMWSAVEGSSVADVALSLDDAVLSVAEEESVLRNSNGDVVWRYAAGTRLMSGRIDAERRAAVFRAAGGELLRVALDHCRREAADCYAKNGDLATAAALYEQAQDHAKAAEMYRAAGDLHNAARNIETAGEALDAASLYEEAGDFDRAARLFEAEGKAERAAECFSRAGQALRAAELFEQAGRIPDAAVHFEQAHQYNRSGILYRDAGKDLEAINVLKQHVEGSPDDMDIRMELGSLLQKVKEYDAAIEQFQYVAKDEERRKPALMSVAECFVLKDLYDVAMNRYRACLKDDESVAWGNLDVYYGLANTLHLAGNYAEAKQIYADILAVDYNYKDVREKLDDVQALGTVFSQPGATVAIPNTAPTAKPVAPQQPFQKLSAETKDRYKIKRELGRGGMGAIYLAEDKRLGRTVALKVLPPELAADRAHRTRMVREAQAVAQIDHPNVVRVFDVGEDEGRSYISMEFIDGRDMRDLLTEKKTLSVEECYDLLMPMVDGLAAAHEKGIAHRDIKPENVMIDKRGRLKLMDFGLALVTGLTRLSMPGAAAGTLGYMPPEQLRGESALTMAVDVFAVGVLAFEMLTGEAPMQRKGPLDLPDEVEGEWRGIPESLARVIAKCMRPDPDERYADAMALRTALDEARKEL